MWSALVLFSAAVPAPALQEPLFAFVQTSDSQPSSDSDQEAFEEGLDTIVESGRAGALLPHRVSFVLFAGDLVDSDRTSEWSSWVSTVDLRLTAHGIPLLAVPGNHDQSDGDLTLYEQFIAGSEPWDAGSAALTGHNGITASTGFAGLRFIGLNNSNGAANQVSSADRTDVQDRIDGAVGRAENVFLIVHHPHDAEGRIPLLGALETPGVVGYLHGHSGSPRARRGLVGVDNDDLWELNTNSLYEDGALIYVEAFPSELHAYVIELDANPTSLPARVVVPLVHDLRPVGPGPAIHDVFPSSVEVFVPGTAETVRIEGSGFAQGTALELDGVALPASSFTLVDGGTLTVDLPPASLGPHTLTVRVGTRSASAPIQAVLPAAPRLQVGTGDPGNPIADGQPVRILASGPVGSQQIVAMSTTLAPSSNSLVQLLIGAGFTDLKLVTVLTVPARGYAEFAFPARVQVPVTVYAQSISRGPAPPFPASNLQSIALQP